jgi:hypothetical protein
MSLSFLEVAIIPSTNANGSLLLLLPLIASVLILALFVSIWVDCCLVKILHLIFYWKKILKYNNIIYLFPSSTGGQRRKEQQKSLYPNLSGLKVSSGGSRTRRLSDDNYLIDLNEGNISSLHTQMDNNL